jgi:transcriptional regulator with XRE-family HTH domain
MSTAETIRSLREAAGLSEDQAALALGISHSAYGDLESYDDELIMSVSLGQARALAKLLGTTLAELLPPEVSSSRAVSLAELSSNIRSAASQSGEGLSKLEELVGWELASFLASPGQVTESRPIMFLQDLARSFEVSWSRLAIEGDAA